MGTRRLSPPPSAAPSLSIERPTHVRLGVLGFACSLSLITYLDRICISRAAKEIQEDLGFDAKQMGLVFSAFLFGYLLFEVPGGWMGDRWGPRRVLTRIVLWWSVFTTLTGCVWPAASGGSVRSAVMMASLAYRRRRWPAVCCCRRRPPPGIAPSRLRG